MKCGGCSGQKTRIYLIMIEKFKVDNFEKPQNFRTTFINSPYNFDQLIVLLQCYDYNKNKKLPMIEKVINPNIKSKLD